MSHRDLTAVLKPYPRYRDSGVTWLGQVPDHWEVRRNKHLLYEVDNRSVDGSEDLLMVSQYTGVTPRRARSSERGEMLTRAASLIGYKIVEPGDLAMNIMLAWNGSLGVSSVHGIVSTAYCVFRPKRVVEPRYLHYLFRTPLVTGSFKTVSTGVIDSRLRLYPDALLRLPSPLPPIHEQAAIVRFLDHAEGRFRRYINAKRKVIALLDEEKRGLIQKAVTRGLGASVRFKASGVDWLGDVPEHWEVAPNRSFLIPKKDVVGPRGKSMTLLSLTLTGVIPRDVDNPEGKWPADFTTYQAVEPGDLVFCLFDMDETPRTVGIARERGMVTGAYDVFGCREPALASYLYLYYVACDSQKRLRPFYTGLRKVIKTSTFLSIKIAVPPPEERRAIVTAVRLATERIDVASSLAKREIELLLEYRARLFADVVSGKVDVGEAAARLSVETGESDGPPVVEDTEELETEDIVPAPQGDTADLT